MGTLNYNFRTKATNQNMTIIGYQRQSEVLFDTNYAVLKFAVYLQ